MEKMGKETKFLLCSITAVCILSFVLSYGISFMLAKEFQKEMMLHDYSVAGYLLNHADELELSAFTVEKNKADIEQGKKTLGSIGYDEDTSMELLPAVSKYRDRITLSLFTLLSLAFGTVYCFIFFFLNRQKKVLRAAENSILEFMDGNTMSRIECEQAGEWNNLFHEINELSVILSSHAENEKRTKEFLQDIISDVSHQLKTPLSALKMYHEIIGNSSTSQETVNDFSQKSLREINRIEDVVYTLLKLARLDAGIIRMEKSKENISALVQDILERFEVWAERENKIIEVLGDNDTVLYCDALWISEAVGNIIKNALENTREGGRLSIQWKQTSLLTQIVIADDGKGIHPEDLYNIFKRFYRSRFSQDKHGVGLGLPLAKIIVENHGGTIFVTSKLDVGTTFTINFFNLTNM